jgi:hypothetical protein
MCISLSLRLGGVYVAVCTVCDVEAHKPQCAAVWGMERAKPVAVGFLAAASLIWLLISFGWLRFGSLDLWIGVPVFGALAVAFAANTYLHLKRFSQKTTMQTRVKQAKSIIMALIGVGVACWFLDVLSTVFVIDIADAGNELNILGWPYSAPAALAYYIPIALITYYLLFVLKTRATFWGATAISALTVFMAVRSFGAVANNLSVAISPSSPAADLAITGIWSGLALVLAASNVLVTQKEKAKMKNLA